MVLFLLRKCWLRGSSWIGAVVDGAPQLSGHADCWDCDVLHEHRGHGEIELLEIIMTVGLRLARPIGFEGLPNDVACQNTGTRNTAVHLYRNKARLFEHHLGSFSPTL